MIRNFLTIAVRNFLRQRLYSFINVIGLASGLMCTLFIYLWVHDEVSKDKFHKDADHIFQVIANLEIQEGEILTWTNTPGPLAEEVLRVIPEIEMAVRVQEAGELLIASEGNDGFMESGYQADPGFFQLFSFEILEGRPATDTLDVSSISISQRLASRLFGTESAVGKTVRVNNRTDFTVAAVFANPGNESSLQFDYVLPYEIYKRNRGRGYNWGNFDHPAYAKLYDPSQAEQAMAKINERIKVIADGDETAKFYLQPFTEAYLYGQFENGLPVGGRIRYVKIFSVVAVFITVIACINFMNMATARASMRAKEVGVRKVVGAQRRSLITQFIGESTLISLFAMVIALAGVYLLLPMFNSLVSKDISLNLSDPVFLGVVVAIVLITGLLAGSYPAFYLSSYQPAHVLKGGAHRLVSGTVLRRGLVSFQFFLTVILIASSLVVYKQISYIMNKDLGYDRESVLTFRLRGQLWDNYETLKNELLSSSAVRYVSRADNSLVSVQNQNASVSWPGKSDESTVFFRTVIAGYDFPETMGLELVDGRFFSEEFNDTTTFLVTERAVELMGLADPVGTEISQWGWSGPIIGVIKDFHGRSMHENMDPFIIMQKTDWAGHVFVRFEGSRASEAIEHVASVYNKYLPEYPFTYSFVDDDFAKLYRSEQVTGSLALGFTMMAIIISALGLLGLAAYTTERRKKEISIRKTLGASVMGIVSMISQDFAKLSLIAAVLGCPVAYYFMDDFLQGYAYRTTLSWDVFLITTGAVILISLLTVIFQVTKAAVANPADALRNE